MSSKWALNQEREQLSVQLKQAKEKREDYEDCLGYFKNQNDGHVDEVNNELARCIYAVEEGLRCQQTQVMMASAYQNGKEAYYGNDPTLFEVQFQLSQEKGRLDQTIQSCHNRMAQIDSEIAAINQQEYEEAFRKSQERVKNMGKNLRF